MRQPGQDDEDDEDAESPAPAGVSGNTEEAAWQPARSLLIEGVDTQSGLERFGGDEGLYLRILRSFGESTGPLLDRIRGVREESLDDYIILVHGIKSSSRGISADGLGAKAESLEYAGKAGDLAFIEDNNDAFIAEAEGLIEGILQKCGEISGSAGQREKDRPDWPLLRVLGSACAAYDIDGIDRAMRELESYSYDEGSDLIVWLRREIGMMNFAEIAKKILCEDARDEG